MVSKVALIYGRLKISRKRYCFKCQPLALLLSNQHPCTTSQHVDYQQPSPSFLLTLQHRNPEEPSLVYTTCKQLNLSLSHIPFALAPQSSAILDGHGSTYNHAQTAAHMAHFSSQAFLRTPLMPSFSSIAQTTIGSDLAKSFRKTNC